MLLNDKNNGMYINTYDKSLQNITILATAII